MTACQDLTYLYEARANKRRVQESNLLGLSPDGFRNHYLTVRSTLQVRARQDSNL